MIVVLSCHFTNMFTIKILYESVFGFPSVEWKWNFINGMNTLYFFSGVSESNEAERKLMMTMWVRLAVDNDVRFAVEHVNLSK